MAEGIRCGCAGMGAFSNAYNHQRGAGADIAARSGPAIRTESSAPSSGQSPSESPFRPINRARFRPKRSLVHISRRGSIAIRTPTIQSPVDPQPLRNRLTASSTTPSSACPLRPRQSHNRQPKSARSSFRTSFGTYPTVVAPEVCSHRRPLRGLASHSSALPRGNHELGCASHHPRGVVHREQPSAAPGAIELAAANAGGKA